MKSLRAINNRLTLVCLGLEIPTTELEVELFENAGNVDRPDDPVPEALKDPFACFDKEKRDVAER